MGSLLMPLELPRRKFLLGLGALIAAPAVVRYANIMPVRALAPDAPCTDWWLGHAGSFYRFVHPNQWRDLVKMDLEYDALLQGEVGRITSVGFSVRFEQGGTIPCTTLSPLHLAI
jgi:hypothetical protein